MHWLSTMPLLAVVAWPAAAHDNEAEKLFRGMEQRVRSATTLRRVPHRSDRFGGC
jgi:hypothetical protein